MEVIVWSFYYEFQIVFKNISCSFFHNLLRILYWFSRFLVSLPINFSSSYVYFFIIFAFNKYFFYFVYKIIMSAGLSSSSFRCTISPTFNSSLFLISIFPFCFKILKYFFNFFLTSLFSCCA